MSAPNAAEGLTWQVDRGIRPAPAWLPTAYETATFAEGSHVQVVAFDRSRVRFCIRAGRSDGERNPTAHELTDDDRHCVLASEI